MKAVTIHYDAKGVQWSCDKTQDRYYDVERNTYCIHLEKSGRVDNGVKANPDIPNFQESKDKRPTYNYQDWFPVNIGGKDFDAKKIEEHVDKLVRLYHARGGSRY